MDVSGRGFYVLDKRFTSSQSWGNPIDKRGFLWYTLLSLILTGLFYFACPMHRWRSETWGMLNIIYIKSLQIFWGEINQKLNKAWSRDIFYFRTSYEALQDLLVETCKRLQAIKKAYLMKTVLVIVIGVIGLNMSFPTIARANINTGFELPSEESVMMFIKAMQNETRAFGAFPMSLDAEPRRIYTIPLTAYSSDPWQTDDTPCITASGLDVCDRDIENVVAANFLPLGTRVRIPELYGDRVFYVEDRMNKRYDKKMDLWMKEYDDAKQFGLKFATIEVF